MDNDGRAATLVHSEYTWKAQTKKEEEIKVQRIMEA
jgi:hypothetical protein